MFQRIFAGAGLLCLAVISITCPALASDGNAIVVPIGDYVSEAARLAGTLLVPLVLVLLARMTGPAGLYLRTFLGERLIRNAIDYAVNAVEGAARGKSLSVKVGSLVIARAVQYAVDQGAPWLVEKLGGVDGIRLKVFRALDLEADASEAMLRARPPSVR